MIKWGERLVEKLNKINYLSFIIVLILSRYNNINHATKWLPSRGNWNA